MRSSLRKRLTPLPPAVKWSGSKRSVAPALSRLFPNCNRFFDPFVGSGALLPFRTAESATAGDVIAELVALWKLIQKDPHKVADGYRRRWLDRQDRGHTAFYEIRDRFNSTRDPEDLLFLSRTCVNGLIRFNSSGHFNNSLHHTRPGIAPKAMERILEEWGAHLDGVEFLHCDYRDTLSLSRRGDFVFLDPPYGGTRGRYKPGSFQVQDFYRELERLNRSDVKWLLTFDGSAGNRTYADRPPEGLFKSSFALATGSSPFSRVMDKKVDMVTETVYANFELESGIAKA